MKTATSPLHAEDDVSTPLRFPLSSAQERCWFINAIEPGTDALNIALRWELIGALDREIVERAFAAIVERHESLRTRVVQDDEAVWQEVRPPFRPHLDEVDLSALPEPRRSEEMVRLGREEAHRPFDPTELPLFRITRLRMTQDRAFLLLTVHQTVFDGWSIRLVSREFGAIAAALNAGRPHDLPDLPLQYGDYAAWQKAYFASRRFEQEIVYWKRQLGDAPYFEVLGDRPRPERPTSNGLILAHLVADDDAAAMMKQVRAKGVTLFSLGCAVMAAALHRRTGAEDIVFGTQVSGREDPDLEPLIGVFINNLVIRLDLSGDPTFDTLVSRANRTVQDALLHQAMPFHNLVEILRPERDPSRMPLIAVNFTVLQDVMENARFEDFELVGHPSLSAGSLYDLNFFMVHWPTGWRMALEYNTDLFDQSTGQALLDLWRDTFLQALARDFRLSEFGPAAQPKPVNEVAGIEQALRRHPAVADVSVVRRRAPDGRMGHHAFVVPRPDFSGVVEGLPALLDADLRMQGSSDPAPSGISILMRLPLTDGFVDREALAQLPVAVATPARRDRLLTAPAESNAVTETAVLRIWGDILGGGGLSPEADFFASGGHSLLALRMLTRVRDATGIQAHVSDLFGAPTLKGFAAKLSALALRQGIRLQQDASDDGHKAGGLDEDWRRIEVRPPGRETSIFGIDSIDDLYDFATDLGGDRGLYSIQLFQAGRPNPFDGKSFQEIARDYVEVIRQVQPAGPYVLFGLCVHGVLAYEIAQQLKDGGQEIELVAFRNAWHPTYVHRLSQRHRWIIRLSQVRDNFRLVLGGEKTFVAFLANYSIVRKSRILDAAAKLRLIAKVPSRTGSDFNDAFLLSLMRARDQYEPPRYDGPVVQYLGADAPRGRGFDPTLGWTGTITGALTLFDETTPKTKRRDAYAAMERLRPDALAAG